MSERVHWRLRARRWQCRLARAGRRLLGLSRTVYVDQRVAEYRGYWEAAARLVGAEFTPLTEEIWEIRRGPRRTRIASYVVPADDPVTLRLAGNKRFCYDLAGRQGVPVPEHVACRLSGLDAGHALLTRRGPPLVVKPAVNSSSGIGVTTLVATPAQLERAAALASLFSDELIVEAMVPAESCRLLFLDGQLLHAVRRRGVRVTGDGRTSLGALMDRHGVRAWRTDPLIRETLAAQRLAPTGVPGAGREIVVRCLPAAEAGTEELRTVYDESITGLVHPALREQLAAVVRALGSRFAGVDVLTNDPAAPLRESGGVFLEINTTPGIHHHYTTPEDRRTHPVAVQVLEYLLTAHTHRGPGGESP